MVNGNTWPFLTVEQRRYRFRFLNGCQSRFLILDFAQHPRRRGVADRQRGRLPGGAGRTSPATNGNRLLMGLAERADMIVDFTNVPVGQLRARQRRARRAVRRRRPRTTDFDAGRPGHDRPDHAVPGRAGAWRRPHHAAAVPRACRRSRRCRRRSRTRPLALLEMMSDGLRRNAGRRRPCSASVDDDGVADGTTMWDDAVTENPGGRRHRGVGVLQLHRRRPPDARARGRVRGRQPAGAGRGSTTASRCSRSQLDGRRRGRPRPGRAASRTRSSPIRAR